jgi:creatinine amidohydrolase
MTAIMEVSWQAFDAKRKETDLAILPLGAVEVYGPHLPLGSDAIVAERVARLVAERTGGIVMPVVPVGYSRSLADFPGTLNVSPAALARRGARCCSTSRRSW